MTRTLRDQIAAVEEAGLTVVRIVYGKHAKLFVAAPDGRAGILTVSGTPGHSNFLNRLRADAKRFARSA